ncbi:MAG: ATP-binding cassette domain-containing protein [Pseudomonadota bacterium]
MISISGLSHRVGAKPILKDITLDIAPGGVTALVGANGAGKSTLLNLVARLIPLQTGRITVSGLDVARTPGRKLARTMAILPQSQETAPMLTVAELVSFGRYPHHQGRPGRADLAAIAEALRTLELEEMADRPLQSLSGGQRQRAYLAMIFAQETEYMLLDEPLNNLDIAASRSLMKTLRWMAEEHGRTVVIVLHDINYASIYADQMVTLTQGRLGPCGAPREILSEQLLRDVFGTDARVIEDGDEILVKV